jgi:hypothetical protein
MSIAALMLILGLDPQETGRLVVLLYASRLPRRPFQKPTPRIGAKYAAC